MGPVCAGVFVVILFLVGFLAITKKIILNLFNLNSDKENIWNNNLELFLLYSLIIIFLTIILIVELNSTVYGGWRQIYYIYPSIVFVSVFGIKILSEKINFKKSFNALLVLLIFLNLFWMIKNHPYQYTYFNFTIKENDKGQSRNSKSNTITTYIS